jgi:Zn-dependent peptidase ImmA (M78 family)
MAVRQKFAELTNGQSHLTRRHVILLASEFAVSREAIVRRLEELGLVRKGTWDWFVENGGISNDQAQEVLGVDRAQLAQSMRSFGLVPHRLALLVREASKRSLYSEGQLAQLLNVDRHEVRAILDGVDMEVSEANELSEIIR